jgi:hypothetical protein
MTTPDHDDTTPVAATLAALAFLTFLGTCAHPRNRNRPPTRPLNHPPPTSDPAR